MTYPTYPIANLINTQLPYHLSGICTHPISLEMDSSLSSCVESSDGVYVRILDTKLDAKSRVSRLAE